MRDITFEEVKAVSGSGNLMFAGMCAAAMGAWGADVGQTVGGYFFGALGAGALGIVTDGLGAEFGYMAGDIAGTLWGQTMGQVLGGGIGAYLCS